MKRGFFALLLLAACYCTAVAEFPSLSLDSIATWGKFPRFCVNTYRWGDEFFNGYDTSYVVGTGYKFNGKITSDSWTDGYHFILPNSKSIMMRSHASTTVGFYLTYLALSVGYDANIRQIFGGERDARKRWRFGFNCMLFAAEFYYVRNNSGTVITHFGDRKQPERIRLAFNDLDTFTWGVDAYYFFNHKRYSEAASFNFSRIQLKSQGSFYTGFSIYTQKLNFNFSKLPAEMRDQLPTSWKDFRYNVHTHNYAVRLGYGYNWVFHRGWCLGITESPIIGIRSGFVNSDISKVSFSLYNRTGLSIVWNHKRWFAGGMAKFDFAIVNDKETTYAGGTLSGEAVVGFRFNIW